MIAGVPSQQVLRELVAELLGVVQRTSGFGLVMLTRVVGEDWRVLEVTDNPYGVTAGDTFKWQDSICSRMVAREEPSPWYLRDVVADDDARQAPVRTVVDISAYAGVPLRGDDGALLGTLCAIDPSADATSEVNDLLRFAERFAEHVLDAESERASRERAAERVLLNGGATGPTIVPKASWLPLLESETARTTWSGERLAVALVRMSVQGDGRPIPITRLAERLVGALAPTDAVSVLGSNRIGIVAVDRAWDEVEAAIADVVSALDADDVVIQTVGAEVVGPASAHAVCEELEAVLVGASAASARSASQQLRYSFCDECGRKGRYQRPGSHLVRCKYCGATDP